MGKWSSATVRPLADTRVKSAAGEVCQARVPLLPGGRIMCNVCNLEHWWHLKKYSGKRKAEMNFCGRYQSWRAPWIAIALLAAKLPVSALLLCGRKPRACVSLAPSFSVYFLRGRLVIELYTSRLCTRCTHNLILNALKSKKHATNYQDTLVFFYFFLTGLRRVCWHLTAQVLVYHPRLPALPSSWPLPSVWVCVSRDEGCLWNLTWCIVERWPDHHWPLARSERLQSRMIFLSLPGVGLSSRGCVPLWDICPMIKHCFCIAFNTSSVHKRAFDV